ncbi:SufE family protein [Chamaesiphon sp. VAR_48_metabat_135_sub]|uniref:SufE family protein n=1 Tax=Chamaesiphon sp. VAR_48_metabat_135_sub TaxID=2964699 RepID=UPI00286A0E83|nr:SufE family protein [Chamaesiphon sp. VAR_48_metabat_135_sub]
MSPVSQPLPPALDRIIQRFQQISESKRRYEYLLHFAKRLPAFPDHQKIPENRVPGCASQVYVIATMDGGKVSFQADSDAQITKGLVGLLVEGLAGLTPAEIMQLTPHFIQQTGLDVSLTPSRANGFYNIFQMMQKRALVCHLTETYLQS